MTLTTTLRRSFPTVFWMAQPVRWIARSRRRTAIALVVTLAVISGPPIWWATQLWRLPDIGDPFDVAAFRALTIPDQDNAFVDYRKAWAVFKPWGRYIETASDQVDIRARWSKAKPEVRQWAEDNREALAVFRRGTERPDALDAVPDFEGMHAEQWKMFRTISELTNLALLEGSRLEDQGDMEGAWGWYRADVRAIHHLGMHGTVDRRSFALRWHDQLRARVTTWAGDRRTTPDLIRRALGDVIACESLSPSEIYTLKSEYLDVDRLLDDPEVGMLSVFFRSRAIAPSIVMTKEQANAIFGSWRWMFREPERSRRVMRLAIANWLAYFERAPEDRPPPDPSTAGLPEFFYPAGPDAPAGVQQVPPRALARWVDSTFDASFLLGNWQWRWVRQHERSNHRELVISLAQELYRRDFGDLPPTPEALLGRYLESLPEELPDQRDETIPENGNLMNRD